MKLIAILLLASLSPMKIAPPPRHPAEAVAKKGGGKWYMTEDGHAIYCYGPSRLIKDSGGDFIRIATFCRGDRAIVKLKE